MSGWCDCSFWGAGRPHLSTLKQDIRGAGSQQKPPLGAAMLRFQSSWIEEEQRQKERDSSKVTVVWSHGHVTGPSLGSTTFLRVKLVAVFDLLLNSHSDKLHTWDFTLTLNAYFIPSQQDTSHWCPDMLLLLKWAHPMVGVETKDTAGQNSGAGRMCFSQEDGEHRGLLWSNDSSTANGKF